MIKIIMKFLLIACFAILTSACSKVKTERWLKKGSGEWQVKSIVRTFTYPFNEVVVLDLSMKFIFDETGSFAKISYTDPGQNIITSEASGTWSVKKDVILLKYPWKEESMKILSIDKKKMELEIDNSSTYDGGFVDVLSLEKSK